jgi:hypothetical protein
MNPLETISSIRIKNLHMDVVTGNLNTLASINQAKAHSKALGGASRVRTARTLKDAKKLRKEILESRSIEVKPNHTLDILIDKGFEPQGRDFNPAKLVTQRDEFEQAAHEEDFHV